MSSLLPFFIHSCPLTNHRFTTKELGSVELTEEHMVRVVHLILPSLGTSKQTLWVCPSENEGDCCCFRGTLGSFVPFSGRHQQSGGAAVPTSYACRKTRDLVCKPLGSALHLSISTVRTFLRGQFCFSGVQGKASVHVGHPGGECVLGSKNKLGMVSIFLGNIAKPIKEQAHQWASVSVSQLVLAGGSHPDIVY